MKRVVSSTGLIILCSIVIFIVRVVMTRPETIGVFPVAIVVDHRNGDAFVANYGSNTISMISAHSDASIHTTAVPTGPLD
jgi:DNA-binding beta-propeller fold protein YncE